MLDLLKKQYGDEYPAAVVLYGVRMPLKREERWMRHYENAEKKTWFSMSRFMDGSASITPEQLRAEWPAWKAKERGEFAFAVSRLNDQKIGPDILRHIMQHGGQAEWCGIALAVSSQLPPEEAFVFLAKVLRTIEHGRAANISQALSRVKHPAVQRMLREHLASVWEHPDLWKDDRFINWVASNAISTIAGLINAGATPAEFERKVKKLAQHVCTRNREECKRTLGVHYPGMADAEVKPAVKPGT